MTTQSNKNLCDYVVKSDISKDHESIIRNIFNALFVSERQHSIKTDHTPSHPTMMTLDIYQVQQLIRSHCDKSHAKRTIIDALCSLAEPRLLTPSTVVGVSELDGKRIDAVRLDYGQTPSTKAAPSTEDGETDELALELSQVNFIESADTSSKWETDAKAWKNKALKLYEQQTIDRDTIQSLRAVIIDMAETLHVADRSYCPYWYDQ